MKRKDQAKKNFIQIFLEWKDHFVSWALIKKSLKIWIKKFLLVSIERNKDLFLLNFCYSSLPYSRDNKRLFENKHGSKFFENKHDQNIET